MTDFTKKIALSLALVIAVFTVQAQTAFYSEDFSGGGIPAGWTNVDGANQGTMWTWCADPANGQGSGCPSIWDDGLNQQSAFASTTATNGFVTMDSDIFGPLPQNHVTRLTTTAIDCSGQSEVWLKFESLIGVFEIAAETGAIVKVSTDGVNFTSYTAFPGLITGSPDPGVSRWSLNPQFTILDISAQAAGQSTVYVQWEWTGNWEYMWNLDDIALYDADPSFIFIPGNNMQVNDFFAVAPNVQWPLSMVEQFGFLADVQNVGSFDQTNVNLNITVIDETTAAVVYSEDLDYGTIGADSLAENVLFAGDGFLPTDETIYTGTYTISADSLDEDPDNDTQEFSFIVTDTTFAKEVAPEFSTRPADDEWDAGAGWSWAYGNVFYVPQANGQYIRTISFAIDGSASPAGELIILKVYEWDDENEDGNVDPDERDDLGFVPYVITGSETFDQVITVPFTDINGFSVPMSDETNYVAMLEYQTDINGSTVEISMASTVDYGAMILRSQTLGDARYGSVLGIGTNLDEVSYSSVGFGSDFVPAVRMSIGDALISSTEDLLDPANALSAFPNPANNTVNLAMDFTEIMKTVEIRLFDAAGRMLQTSQLENIQSHQASFDVSALENGSYFFQVITEQGFRTERFAIQR